MAYSLFSLVFEVDMSKLQGRAKKFDGTAIDYVSIFNWLDGKCIKQVVPNDTGNWSYDYFTNLKIGITYVADGCEPITHGAYDVVGNRPVELFANNEYGAWYDPSDLSTLFQDAAGTVPVANSGDPVGLMLDKSGNNLHVKQTTSNSRPIYRTDGVKYWLDFDNSYLETDIDVTWSSGAFYHCSALSYKNPLQSGKFYGEFRFLRKGGAANATNQNYYEVYTDATGKQVTLYQRYPSGGGYAAHSYLEELRPDIGTAFVQQATQKSTGLELQIHPNMSSKIIEPYFAGASGLAKLSIGLGYGGTSQQSKMLWYGMIWRSGAISAEHEETAAKYFGYLSGVEV